MNIKIIDILIYQYTNIIVMKYLNIHIEKINILSCKFQIIQIYELQNISV